MPHGQHRRLLRHSCQLGSVAFRSRRQRHLPAAVRHLAGAEHGGAATNIATTCNTFAQNRAKAVGTTSTVDARANTDTEATDTDAAIYWLNGNKAADNYADFTTGTWDR